ncbi:MAG: hypothetical protein HY253_00010 [Burkholderiales bacterium]|nr:hypothetical protein [Burkholderiales bacterium]
MKVDVRMSTSSRKYFVLLMSLVGKKLKSIRELMNHLNENKGRNLSIYGESEFRGFFRLTTMKIVLLFAALLGMQVQQSHANVENVAKTKIPSVSTTKKTSKPIEKAELPSPEWRVQMSEVIPGNAKGAKPIWLLAKSELLALEPNLNMKEWEPLVMQRLVVGDAEFYLFKWISEVERRDGYMDGDLPYFSGKTHWFLLTKKGDRVVYKKRFDDNDEYSMPAQLGSSTYILDYDDSKDRDWKRQCKKTDFRKNNNPNATIYRECPAFAKVASNGVETILFSVFVNNEQSDFYYSFDIVHAQLTSVVDVLSKYGENYLQYDQSSKTLYLESTDMTLTRSGDAEVVSARQLEAAKAFAKSRLGDERLRLRSCLPTSCIFGARRVLRRFELSSQGEFQENVNATLGHNRLEVNNHNDRDWLVGENNRIQELENKAWNRRVEWVLDYLGLYAAVKEPQRIRNAWLKIPDKIKRDIDPSEIALYWAAVGYEGLLKVFPSPLLDATNMVK